MKSWEEMNLKELLKVLNDLKNEFYKEEWRNEFVRQEIKEIENMIKKLKP